MAWGELAILVTFPRHCFAPWGSVDLLIMLIWENARLNPGPSPCLRSGCSLSFLTGCLSKHSYLSQLFTEDIPTERTEVVEFMT